MTSVPRILVIEDNYALRRLYVRNLTNAGFDVMEAGDLQEVDTMLSKYAYDMILGDIELADGNSFDVLANLREAGVPVIAMSSDYAHEEAAHNIGVDYFFTKPIPSRTLAERVTAILEESTH
jgi:DNA-binding response OmpR family regulator